MRNFSFYWALSELSTQLPNRNFPIEYHALVLSCSHTNMLFNTLLLQSIFIFSKGGKFETLQPNVLMPLAWPELWLWCQVRCLCLTQAIAVSIDLACANYWGKCDFVQVSLDGVIDMGGSKHFPIITTTPTPPNPSTTSQVNFTCLCYSHGYGR